MRTDSPKTDHMPPRDTHLSREVSIRVRRPPETTAPSLAECVLDLGTQGPRSSPCNQVPTKLVPLFPLSQWVCPTMAKMVPGSPRLPRASCPRLGKYALHTTYLTSRWVRTAARAERVGGSLNAIQVSQREEKAPLRRKGAVGARVTHPAYALEEIYLSPQVRASLVAKRFSYQFCPGAPTSDQPVISTTWLPSQAPDNPQPGIIPPAAGHCNTTTTQTTAQTTGGVGGRSCRWLPSSSSTGLDDFFPTAIATFTGICCPIQNSKVGIPESSLAFLSDDAFHLPVSRIYTFSSVFYCAKFSAIPVSFD